MIAFRCRCSHRFEVADDRAGESFQCPACGLLVDVPTIEETRALQEDGSYVLTDAAPPTAVLPRLGDTPSIASRHDAKDRRLSLKEFLSIGTTDDDLLEIRDEVRAGVPKHPKYDPETGELIVPMELKRPPLVAHPVTAEPAVLGYEVRRRDGVPSIWMPLYAMFELPNLVVCAIVTAMYAGALFMAGVAWFFSLLVLPVFLLIVAHLANVVDETGPTGNDEIPRPLRGASLYDDLIRPLGQVFLAYALAYAPIVLFNLYVARLPAAANGALLVLFFILVPALLLTLITSGALNNLLPNRALSVIGASSWHYWVAVASGFVATFAFNLATALSLVGGLNFLNKVSNGQAGGTGTVFGLPRSIEWALTPLLMLLAMYLLHVFAWQLGVIYRLHHERFAWVLQKHDKVERADTLSQLHVHRQRLAEARARAARDNLAKRLEGIGRE